MPGVPMMNNMTSHKYWSWIAVFTVSILFWSQLIWLALHSIVKPRYGGVFCFPLVDQSEIYQFGLLSKRYDIFVLSLITALMIVGTSL